MPCWVSGTPSRLWADWLFCGVRRHCPGLAYCTASVPSCTFQRFSVGCLQNAVDKNGRGTWFAWLRDPVPLPPWPQALSLALHCPCSFSLCFAYSSLPEVVWSEAWQSLREGPQRGGRHRPPETVLSWQEELWVHTPHPCFSAC